ncbi:MAG: rhodanese-like domain-containing protein [Rhodospirillaceae bacterium]|nr:MAG: rhodanese-like domain-containing protein [Rhodospirillaceae bacterium]
MAYAGDLTASQAWELLSSDPTARLVDVRTAPEWAFVGRPDLQPIGKAVLLQSWQHYPQMAVDPDFATKLTRELGEIPQGAPLLFLCRSGARSKAAAIAMTAAGHTRCYNVAGGFEGDRDGTGHRGTTGGWKVAGLPWVQD